MNEWIEIARTGKYEGKLPLSRAVFTAVLRNFARQKIADGVPNVIGHPESDAPAWGWVSELEIRENGEAPTAKDRLRGASLWMKADMTPALQGIVRDKLYKNRSIRLGLADDGTFELRHVGWLGAVTPAVPNMQAVSLSGDEFGEDFIFSAQDDGEKGDAMLIRTKGRKLEKQDPGTGATAPKPEAATAPETTTSAKALDFSALETRMKDMEASNKALKEKLDAANAQAEARASEASLEKARAFCADLTGKGVLPPSMAFGLPEFLAGLPVDAEGLSFSAADGKETKQSPRAYMEAWLSRMPKAGMFSHVAVRTGEASEDKSESDKLYESVLEYAKEKGVTPTEAFNIITNQG